MAEENPTGELRPDAKLDILDVNIDVTAAVRCRCVNAPIFLVASNRPGTCSGCKTVYVVKQLRVQIPAPQGGSELAINIGPRASSAIVMPGGGLSARRN